MSDGVAEEISGIGADNRSMESSLPSNTSIAHARSVDQLDEGAVDAALEAIDPIVARARSIGEALASEHDAFGAEARAAVLVADLLCLPEQLQRIGAALFTAAIGADGSTADSAVLHALSAIAGGAARVYATTEAERLAAEGIPAPIWALELVQPITSTGSWMLSPVLESGGAPRSVMVVGFRRAGSQHGFVVHFDHRAGGAIRLVEALHHDAWTAYRGGLMRAKALEVPYAVEVVDFEDALEHFGRCRDGMWSALRRSPDHYRADPDMETVPGLTLLLERHLSAAT